MKAIIPVAGAGTNLRPHTYTQPKSLIPVAGKPILGFIVDQLHDIGITEYVFIIGYLGEKIKEYISHAYPRLKASYVTQQSRDGLGHAISLTKKVIPKDSEVIIILGDTIIETDLKKFSTFPGSALGIKKVENPQIFGVVEINDKGLITKVIEKPTIPKSNMALVGLYKIKEYDVLIESLDDNLARKYKSTQEFTLTDGLQGMIERGIKFSGFKVDNWYDCGQKEVLLQTNALLLKKNQQVSPANLPLYENTIIVDPVHIGKYTVIKNSIIGPNVTIGDNAQVTNSIVKDSIIGSFTRLKETVLHNSIIGSDSFVQGSGQSLNIGDNTDLDLR